MYPSGKLLHLWNTKTKVTIHEDDNQVCLQIGLINLFIAF